MSKNSANNIFDHICNVMTKLDKKEITTEEAVAHSKLAQNACNLLSYELKRSAQTSQPIRELETKAFDNV
jgi:hypothetical protein